MSTISIMFLSLLLECSIFSLITYLLINEYHDRMTATTRVYLTEEHVMALTGYFCAM